MSFDLDAEQIRQLLDELDQRLSAAGIAATVYVVGGALVRMLLDTGMRRGEISGLRRADIDLDEGVAIVLGKAVRGNIIALATVLQVDPEEAVQLTLKAYGAEALAVMTKLEDVTYDAHALIPERPRD